LVSSHRDELIQDVKELISIQSMQGEPAPGMPFGPGPAAALDKAVEFGKRYQYETENDNYYTVSFYRHGETKEEIGILGHIDVVPAGDDWDYDPFNAVVKDGYHIGHGSGDNKGTSIASLYVLRALDCVYR
jgi:succinyl-diaminopimelate desuccinylase